MCSRVDQAALSSDADCRQRVVTGDHAASKMCGSKSLNGRGRSRLEFILEDNQAKESQAGFRLLATSNVSITQDMYGTVSHRFIF